MTTMATGITSRYLKDESATLAFGRSLANRLTGGCVIYLHGELGAGKTTLVRGILQGLGYQDTVKSPTYTLVESYFLTNFTLYHFDLYRLGSPEELEYLGIRDFFDQKSVMIIEWPERGGDYLPIADIDINLAYHKMGRKLGYLAQSALGAQCLTP